MKNDKLKDIIALWIISLSNSPYFIWPIILMYLASYQKHFDESTTFKEYFSFTLGLFFGFPIAGSFISKMIFLFGPINTMRFTGILSLFSMLLFFYL